MRLECLDVEPYCRSELDTDDHVNHRHRPTSQGPQTWKRATKSTTSTTSTTTTSSISIPSITTITTQSTTTSKATTTAPSLKPPVQATLVGDNHDPTVNRPWHYTVTITDSAGHKLSGTETTHYTFSGVVVGTEQPTNVKFTNGVYHDTLEFPSAAVGHPLDVQVVVHTSIGSKTVDWAIQVNYERDTRAARGRAAGAPRRGAGRCRGGGARRREIVRSGTALRGASLGSLRLSS